MGACREGKEREREREWRWGEIGGEDSSLNCKPENNQWG